MILIAATQNRNKIQEIEAITAPYDIQIISRSEAGVPDFEIDEDGTTFEENSKKKAQVITEYTNKASIADDSGLEVYALNNEPGVFSARYAGVDGEDADRANNAKLLDLMKDIPAEDRGARFVSVITLVYPDGKTLVARGECEGSILFEPRGKEGFGYDPLFLPEGEGRTFAELSLSAKNSISHRGRALRKLGELLKENE